jgi:penicillin amidase
MRTYRNVGVLSTALVMILASSAWANDAAHARGRVNPVRPVQINGLHAAVQVKTDVDGIPHILANNERDMVLIQGWVHARDRLFQMDLTRRQASGTLAELMGPSQLGSDVELRTIGLRRAAERSLASTRTWRVTRCRPSMGCSS